MKIKGQNRKINGVEVEVKMEEKSEGKTEAQKQTERRKELGESRRRK